MAGQWSKIRCLRWRSLRFRGTVTEIQSRPQHSLALPKSRRFRRSHNLRPCAARSSRNLDNSPVTPDPRPAGSSFQAQSLARENTSDDHMALDHAADGRQDRGYVLPCTQAPPRGSKTAFNSSTTKDTSPPRRKTADIIRVSATVQAKCPIFLELTKISKGRRRRRSPRR